MQPIRTAACALVLALAAGAAAAAPSWQVQHTSREGVPVIANPDIPRDGEQVLTAHELWRLGADEANDPLIGLLSDAVTDDDGNAYVLDTNLSTIHVIGPDGTLLRSIGAEGDGPGEFRNATELAFMPDGDLGVMEMMPGNIVVIDRFGEPRGSFRPAGTEDSPMMLPQRFAADADGVVVGFVNTNFGADKVVTRYALERFRSDGSPAATYASREEEQENGQVSIDFGGGDDAFTANWALAADGRVVVYRRRFAYELEVYAPDGTLERIVTRDYETLRRSDEELARMRREIERLQERFHGAERTLEERAPDIGGVHPRPDGSLWVETSRGVRACPDGSLGVYDVFDPAGHYVRTLRLDGVDYASDRDDFVIDGDRLYVFKEAQKAPPRTTTAGGGGMQMVMITGGGGDEDEDEDDGELRPFEVVCYRIGD